MKDLQMLHTLARSRTKPTKKQGCGSLLFSLSGKGGLKEIELNDAVASPVKALSLCSLPDTFCRGCKSKWFENELINKTRTGWRVVDGNTTFVEVDNYCCPDPSCGSNDLVFGI